MERFKKLGISEEKLAKLKSIGVDLRYHLTYNFFRDERVDAALSTIVLIGKVLHIEDFFHTVSSLRADTINPFHSKVVIEVIDLLKSHEEIGDTIEILRHSGKIKQNGEILDLISSADPSFTIGDTSVFYLTNVDQDSYIINIYKSYISNRKQSNSETAYRVGNGNKHDVHNSVVDYYNKKIPLDIFKAEIKKVSEILD